MRAVAATEALAGITGAALAANCGHCWAAPGEPCATALSGGMHLARLDRAYRRGLLTAADFMLVVDTLDAFTEASVLYEAKGLAA